MWHIVKFARKPNFPFQLRYHWIHTCRKNDAVPSSRCIRSSDQHLSCLPDGIPEYLHLDQGRNFEFKLLKEMCKALEIIKTHTTAYHPQENALVERSNRTVLKMLRCYTEKKSCKWEESLSLVLFTYRTTKYATTGISPFDPPSMIHLTSLSGYEPTA